MVTEPRPLGSGRACIAFLALAAALYAQPAIPSPESHFGHRIGQDRTTLEWAAVVDYFTKLDAASPRVTVKEFGKSTEGRPLIAAFISSPANLRRLDAFQGVQKKLADSRQTPAAEAEKLMSEGKTVVLITCSVHATEIASTHTAVEYAYRMATADTAKANAILDNVILILVPSINPDGVDIVTRWYRKTLGTPFEGTSPPELYQKYTGHDNNRDWYIFSQAETRAVVSQLHNQWYPQIVYDVHQQGPNASRIFVPPWLDPIDPNVDPALVQMGNMVGMTMAADLTAAGRKGVAVNAIYDFWTPARHYQAYHGGMRILTESASARIASPIAVRAEDIAAQALGYSPRERSWNYMEPWLGGEWKLRDIIDDQVIAFDSVLYTAAVRRDDLLRNFYNILKRASERRIPSAFSIPFTQRDPGASRQLLETLSFGGVEIDKGSAGYFVRMQQPFSAFAKTLLERQKYPDLRMYPGGPPRRPYDVTAQTLPLLMGVQVDTLDQPPAEELARTAEFRSFRGGLASQGWVSAADSDAWRRVTAAWRAQRKVWRDPRSGNFYFGSVQLPGAVALAKPRVGIYKSFVPSMDEGWTRWILERFGWEYSSVGNAAMRAGNLREKYDVLIIPDQASPAIANGHRAGSMPEEFTGGLGKEGAGALRTFAEQGGRILFFNSAVDYAIDFLGIKVRNGLRGVTNRDFYCPGSLLSVRQQSGESPLTRGLPPEFTVWFESSPLPEPLDDSARVVLRYAPQSVLASGWLLGEKFLAGKPALLDVKVGQGHIYLFGMRPQYRAQSYLTLKMVFNALAG